MRLLALAVVLAAAPAQEGKKWSGMDYGPFMTHSFEAKGKNLAYKGILVRLGPGGAAMLFDADLLRANLHGGDPSYEAEVIEAAEAAAHVVCWLLL